MPDCRIAAYYGIDPARLNSGQKLAYLANIGRFEAEKRLAEGGLNLSGKDVHRLTLLATGDHEKADIAAAEQWRKRLFAGMKHENE